MRTADWIKEPGGRIYHLDLLPEEVSTTFLLVGDPGRVSQVSQHFDRVEIRRTHREFVTHTGTLGTKRLSVVSTGIGTDNVDIVLNELDALFNLDFELRRIRPQLTQLTFIRIGTSGSLHPEVPVDAFLVNSHALGLDNLLRFYPYTLSNSLRKTNQLLQKRYPCLARLPVKPLLTEADSALVSLFAHSMHQGVTITAPGFYGPQGREFRLPSLLRDFLENLDHGIVAGPRITNFEMETSGIYGLASLLGHRAVSCNLILANRVANTFHEQPNLAMDRFIVQVLEKVAGM